MLLRQPIALLMTKLETGMRGLPPQNVELEALKHFQACIRQITPLAMEEWPDSRLTALMLDLALKYDSSKLAYELLEIIGTQMADLAASAARDAALAPRIGQIVGATSILREATGLTKNQAQQIAFELAQSIALRLRSGEPQPYATLSWANLVAWMRMEEAATQDDEHDAVLPFIRPPARPEQIILAETQLGIVLPQDYKV